MSVMVPQIVLCAMLSGELPWMKAKMTDENFDKWVKNEHNYSPWTNVSIEVISLCRRILNPNPIERISMKDLLESKWCYKKIEKINFNSGKVNDETFSVQSSKRLKLSSSSALSQPTTMVSQKEELKPSSPDPHRDIEFIVPNKNYLGGMSLPVLNEDLAKMMDYASQTQSQTQTRNSDLVIKMPRASRIGLNPDLILRSEVIQILTESLKDYKMTERVEGRTWRLAQNVGAEPLVFNVTLYDIEGAKIRLLDFARQRGDSVLFRKVFASLRKKFSKFTDKIKFDHKIKMGHAKLPEEPKTSELNKENVQSNSQPMVDDEEK